MISKKDCRPEKNSASALRYLRDRISVPRDMPLLSGRLFRQALERTANIDGNDIGPEIPIRNRLDQNPIQFK